ncbi:MAG: transposase [Deltaproteobacteria bacterium]|nr:transposase [Deltaproteobacteria bacterium]
MDVIELMEKGKIKRVFRARRKLNYPRLIYHITQRAAGNEPLFLEQDDYLSMLVLMKEICRTHNINMHAFCLMPNHIHFLLSLSESNLSESMRNLFSRYAQRFNKKYERKGHLFAGPFRQSVCLDDAYILAASLYIHLNPVKAGLASSPMRYRWSSARLYCSDSAGDSFVDPTLILGLIGEGGHERGSTQKKRYKDLIRRGAELELGNIMEQDEAIDKLTMKLHNMFGLALDHVFKKNRVPAGAGLELLPMVELEAQIEQLKKAGVMSKPQSMKARRYLIEQLVARGFKREEIAEKLGVSRKTVYNILRKQL